MINTFKKPDLKAPRYRKTKVTTFNQKFCDAFYEKYPQYKKYPKDTLEKIIVNFNGKLWNQVIEYRDGIELMESLGNLFIGSCKPSFKDNPDYKKLREYNVEVPHRNLSSESYLAKIFYTNSNNKYRFKHRGLWKFKGVRQFTRATSETYRKQWEMYRVIEDYEKISAFFRKCVKARRRANFAKSTRVPDNYNAFDID